ncbi:MAG: O-methyltransferase [Clostridia bacterium]|nr:O-methyltransferase [Clostridia bacterium]
MSEISNGIIPDYIVDYIRERVPMSREGLRTLEAYAHEHGVPIIHPEVGQFLKIYIKTAQVKRILEVGTAIGYSALVFADAIEGKGHIDTIEIREASAERAVANIKTYNQSDVTINVHVGDALDVLPTLTGPYDLVFLDAGKSHYDKYFDYADQFIGKHGIIISDNVLYKGMTATDDLVIKRKKTIVKNMRNFLDELVEKEGYDTVIMPLGDGVAISTKLGE